METQFTRTQYLLGADAIETLKNSKVAVFGIGGVGGHCVEALARSGIGALELIDNDTVSISNLNRQLVATHRTIGKYKTEAMRERILDIDPECEVTCRNTFYLPENAHTFHFEDYDYVVDAIDTVTAKLDIIERCSRAGVPVISSMGTGNKLDPTKFVVTDVFQTSMDPLARVMRRELKKRGVEHLKVVYSTEQARRPITEEVLAAEEQSEENLADDAADQAKLKSGDGVVLRGHSPRRKDVPGSTPFVPSVAGLIIAGEVIKDLTGVR